VLCVEESLTLLGCMFRGLELILLFKQSAVLLFSKSGQQKMPRVWKRLERFSAWRLRRPKRSRKPNLLDISEFGSMRAPY
jgi:hypothetical protein